MQLFKGHQKTSFIDYPDKICTVLFVGGCNFRCPYCHNGELVNNEGEFIDEEYIFDFLNKRRKMLDGVCISGGEATLYNTKLYDFITRVKKLDYLVKLDTNGTNPELLKNLIDNKLIDYVAMDIKAPFDKYEDVVNVKIDIENIKKSIDIIRNSNIDYEFRTTVCKELLTKEDIIELAESIKGSKRYIMQNFKDGETVLAGKGKFTSYKGSELKNIEESIKGWFEEVKIRG
ncbi:anaerobic ribonucleoside-triphosphate reductase activating protein [Caldisalinibacter kiritimatiensis]|uniref:Ribonucleotide reductase of class III (Anaerobic), activating protein n=1 Tax=Caldisalinibacter kiritimatiensis TaxID=1304284 RepID=R1CS92_9FIRM|nr:anaerobic ribonucleoside-triphosphate reductase activating protein [Caldisalinibacter kiritimatiensis]EOC99573.1 Ribonucleotide reductase of class III (anaerobic), activating protein [Caldisalinibacter kiritimatiensis]